MPCAWKLKRVKGGYIATMTAGLTDGGAITTHARSQGKEAAIMKAAGLLMAASQNPIAAALLPPGSAASIKYAGKLAKAVRAGKGAKLVAKAIGPGAKRLIKKLKFW